MNPPAAIHLLGRFLVDFTDRQVTAADFERRSGADLVQLLALQPGRTMHREQVMEHLWPDLELRSAMNQFHKASSFARAGLGERQAIVIRDEQVRLYPAVDVVVDLHVLLSTDLDDSASRATARSVWHGDLLPESPYAEWATDWRRTARQTYVQVLERSSAWDELATLDPSNETAQVGLMRRSIAEGDRAGVIQRFDLFAAALLDATGLEPGPDAIGVRDQALEDAPVRVRGLFEEPASSGREEEARKVVDHISGGRHVTITGPGGVGKTHLLHVLRPALSAMGLRRVDVSFGGAEQFSGAMSELLDQLGALRQADTDDVESIIRTIGDDPTLLALDNCEHLLDETRSFVTAVLQRCTNTRVLATSRHAIDTAEERVVRLGPLDRAAATELFVAEAHRHDVTVDPDDPLVDRICATVDDLPLALRLAAARSRSIDLVTLADLLTTNLSIIGDDTPAGNRRTLRESVTWSINALSQDTSQALISLASLAGRFDISAAFAVIGEQATDAVMLQNLDELVASSLLLIERTESGVRYRLPEAIKYYVREGGVDAASQRRHLLHFRDRAVAADALLSEDYAPGVRAFESILADVRAAVSNAVALGEVEEGYALVAACATNAILSSAFEIIEWCERLVAVESQPMSAVSAATRAAGAVMLAHRLELGRAEALLESIEPGLAQLAPVRLAHGWLQFCKGNTASAGAVFDELLERTELSPMLQANTILIRAGMLWARGEEIDALAHRLEVLAAGRGPAFDAQAGCVAGMAALSTEPVEALALVERAAAHAEEHRQLNLYGTIAAARVAGLAATGDVHGAMVALRDNLRWTHRNGVWTLAMEGLAAAASLLETLDRPDLAVTIAGAQASSGFVSGLSSGLVAAMLDRIRTESPTDFDAWWNAGARLDVRAATSFGVDALDGVLSER